MTAALPVVGIVDDVVERAVLCADGRVHFSMVDLSGLDTRFVIETADKYGSPTGDHNDSVIQCGPHTQARRHVITTAWETIS